MDFGLFAAWGAEGTYCNVAIRSCIGFDCEPGRVHPLVGRHLSPLTSAAFAIPVPATPLLQLPSDLLGNAHIFASQSAKD